MQDELSKTIFAIDKHLHAATTAVAMSRRSFILESILMLMASNHCIQCDYMCYSEAALAAPAILWKEFGIWHAMYSQHHLSMCKKHEYGM